MNSTFWTVIALTCIPIAAAVYLILTYPPLFQAVPPAAASQAEDPREADSWHVDDLKFSDELPPLPPLTDGQVEYRQKLNDLADALRAHPGKWVEYPGMASTQLLDRAIVAAAIKLGSHVCLKPSEFEAAVRKGVLYVRYIGGVA